MSAILIPVIIYDSYIERKTQKMLNDAATTNFIRHEDALRIIVNHIKNAE